MTTERDLVLFACPGKPQPPVVERYEAALPEGAELRWIAPPGRSTVFGDIGRGCRGQDGRVLPGLLARRAPGKWRSVSLVSFSAGYGLAREVLAQAEDRRALWGYVALDSIHAALADRQPNAAQLRGFAAYAAQARRFECLFALGHTDVQTPQKPAPGVVPSASTTQCAGWLVKTVPPGGAWIVRAYDLRDDAHQMAEHSLALTEWGPELVADTLGTWLSSWVPWQAGEEVEQPPDAERAPTSAPWLDPTLPRGERAVSWSLAELERGVCEQPPGSNTGPEIKRYLAPCERGGKLLGLVSAPWCAAAACAAELATRLPGETPAHPYRCSGAEMVADARAFDRWRERGCGYGARRGDVGIYRRRSKADPDGRWQRHVVRVETAPASAGAWRGIGGNEGERWRLTERRLDDADLLGFIESLR